jgi:hypothetical protein
MALAESKLPLIPAKASAPSAGLVLLPLMALA